MWVEVVIFALAVIKYLLVSLLVLSPEMVVECFLWVVLGAFHCVL